QISISLPSASALYQLQTPGTPITLSMDLAASDKIVTYHDVPAKSIKASKVLTQKQTDWMDKVCQIKDAHLVPLYDTLHAHNGKDGITFSNQDIRSIASINSRAPNGQIYSANSRPRILRAPRLIEIKPKKIVIEDCRRASTGQLSR
ncbi:MAG: hypothetical protein Q9183_005981, partial [Haloplaca sp. 2 TL-2023]